MNKKKEPPIGVVYAGPSYFDNENQGMQMDITDMDKENVPYPQNYQIPSTDENLVEDIETIFCLECGAKVPRKYKFCGECGSLLPREENRE